MKYFYTDPSKAGWMNERFGVELTTPFKYEYDYGNSATFVGNPTADKIYVHPDSYPIFEMRIGDLVLHKRGRIAKRLKESEKVPGLYVHFLGCMGNIIERDGKQFFMPEKE